MTLPAKVMGVTVSLLCVRLVAAFNGANKLRLRRNPLGRAVILKATPMKVAVTHTVVRLAAARDGAYL
jgi:hypothetical protein